MKPLAFVIFSLFFVSVSIAQDLKEYSEINVIPPSPNAAAFQKFVEIPVSLYTGIPNITVPIYEIKMKQLSLPISLQYHASGLKVDEFASWVGAGWTLNAGGLISRSTKGLPDELNDLNTGKKGFFYNRRLYSANGTVNINKVFDCEGSEGLAVTPSYPVTVADSVSNGILDLEPDLFVFNFPGGAGKFSFPFTTKNGENNPIKYTDDDIKILEHPFDNRNDFPSTSSVTNDYRWVFETPDGTMYTFERAEYTNMYSVCGDSFSPYNPSFGNYQNSWHLTQIENNGEWIKFEYEEELQKYDRKYSESAQFKIVGSGFLYSSSECYNKSVVRAQRLALIYTSEGDSIKFVENMNSREDLEGSHRLDRIEIYKCDYPVKFFQLDYSYFGNKYKLKLESITPKANASTTADSLNGYDFSYYEGGFPSMDSNSQDYWGFYNGAPNTTGLIPAYKTKDYHINRISTTSREPNIHNTRIGALKGVTYPTGGKLSLEYELNDYFQKNYKSTYHFTAHAIGTDEVTKRFSVSQDCSATLTIPENPTIDSYTEIRRLIGNSYVKVTLTNTPLGNRHILPAGDYELFAHNEGEGSAFIGLEYEQEESLNVNVGGLRVKRTSFHDSFADFSLNKRYEYSFDSLFNQSSGVLFTPPSLGGYLSTRETGVEYTFGCSERESAVYLNLSSHMQVPLAIYNGSHIGYSEVKEYVSTTISNTKELGYTVYTYINEKDERISDFPYVPNMDYSFKNGKIKTETTYEKNDFGFSKVRSIENKYTQIILSGKVGGMNFKRNRSTFCYDCDRNNYSYNEYFTQSVWYNLTKSVVTEYNQNDIPIAKKTYEYEYDSYALLNLPAKKILYSAEQDAILEQYVRDPNFPALIKEYKKIRFTPIYPDSRDSTVVKRSTVVEGRKVKYHGRLVEEFYSWNDVTKSWVWESHLVYDNNQLKEKVTFPQQSGSDGDMKTSYIFGYQQTSPVIVCENIDYDLLSTAVASAINSIGVYSEGLLDLDSLLNDLYIEVNSTDPPDWGLWDAFNQNLRNQASMSDALITTYTHQPGVGISSVTDNNGYSRYYIYDQFNRLVLVKDAEMNIIKEIHYNYRDLHK